GTGAVARSAGAQAASATAARRGRRRGMSGAEEWTGVVYSGCLPLVLLLLDAALDGDGGVRREAGVAEALGGGGGADGAHHPVHGEVGEGVSAEPAGGLLHVAVVLVGEELALGGEVHPVEARRDDGGAGDAEVDLACAGVANHLDE